MTRRLTAALLACICMISFVLIMIPVQASAEETQQFTGEAILLKQENSAYTFQITVSNNGHDFDGTVRFQITDSNGNACSAYDTYSYLYYLERPPLERPPLERPPPL